MEKLEDKAVRTFPVDWGLAGRGVRGVCEMGEVLLLWQLDEERQQPFPLARKRFLFAHGTSDGFGIAWGTGVD